MNPRFLFPAIALLLINTSCSTTANSAESGATPVAATAPDAQPAPELTEVWTPVPPIVTAPPGGIPSDAIVLFDGKNLDEWEPVRPGGRGWKIEDDAMVIVPTKEPDEPFDQRTKRSFGDVQLHIEFRTPAKVEGSGQGRGNSGVFFMGLYELQILDSYDNKTYSNGQVGSIYKQHIPLANASRAPGEWQSFDAIFVAPRFDADGKLVTPARLTALHNGVLVQYDVELKGPTTYRGAPVYRAHSAKLPLVLQDHRNPTAFRNIWIREITLPHIK
jgi:hypothetical protein